MISLRVFGLLFFALSLGFWAGSMWNKQSVSVVPVTDNGYRVTPHNLKYYDLLQVKHQPAPKDWKKLHAGSDYCANLASWFRGAARKISKGILCIQIHDGFAPQLAFEVHMGYLTADDRNRIFEFISMAPFVPVEQIDALGNGAYAECRKNLRVPA